MDRANRYSKLCWGWLLHAWKLGKGVGSLLSGPGVGSRGLWGSLAGFVEIAMNPKWSIWQVRSQCKVDEGHV